jgi:hypothetical protein
VSVLIALADVGSGVQLEEVLANAGLVARWDATQADGPQRTAADAAVVVLDADHLGTRLLAVADAWRDRASVPGVIAMGSSATARELAPRARVTLLAPAAKTQTVVAAIRDAAKLRLATEMRWPVLRAAVGLPAVDDSPAAWQPTLAAARTVDAEIPRTALRWHAHHYATPTARLDELRADRILTVPELATLAHLDGTRTVQSVIAQGPLEMVQAARVVWALVSMGAIELSPEVHDIATPARRSLHELRVHLRARAKRLQGATYYDVLEISPLAEYGDIEAAYRLVGQRYAPDVLARHDLADVTGVEAMWAIVEKARSVLVDQASRGRYHDWLRSRELHTVWAIEPAAARHAIEAFARGQHSLADGDVHRAMSDLAAACRHHPGHPDYESSLAWARFRVQVASGRDQVECANHERKLVEEMLLGCRAWPRALVALALLCAASGDVDSARWHLHTALVVDPNVPAATQLARRLGMVTRRATP